MILALGNYLTRDGKGIGIGDKKITVHVVAGGDARRGRAAGLEGMAGIARNAAGVNQADRIQHYAAIFIEKHVIANCLANDLQSDALRLECGRVRTVVKAFDRTIIHEVKFDVADAPVFGEGGVGVTQILLGAGIRAVQHIERIEIG